MGYPGNRRRETWAAVPAGLPPLRDAVARLHRFQGEYLGVRFTSPVIGRYGPYTALVPPGAIPGESLAR